MIAQPSLPALRNGKVDHAMPTLSKIEQHTRVVELIVDLLIARTSIGDCWTQGFQDAESLLATVPFLSTDYVSATRHLWNALGYCYQEEFGAAAFELRALRGQLLRL